MYNYLVKAGLDLNPVWAMGFNGGAIWASYAGPSGPTLLNGASIDAQDQLVLDGINDFAAVGTPSDVDAPSGSSARSYFFNVTKNGTSAQTMFTHGDETALGTRVDLRISGTNAILRTTNSGSTGRITFALGSFDGSCAFVLTIPDGASTFDIKAYCDGVELTPTFTTDVAVNTTDVDLNIGAGIGGLLPANGIIRTFMVFDFAMSAAQAKRLTALRLQPDGNIIQDLQDFISYPITKPII